MKKSLPHEWYRFFFNRLSTLRLIDRGNFIESKLLTFVAPERKYVGKEVSFNLALFDHFPEEKIINELMQGLADPNETYETPSIQFLLDNALVMRELARLFYERFANELMNKIRRATRDREDYLVEEVPLIADFICHFAIRRQLCLHRKMVIKHCLTYDNEDKERALRRMGLNLIEINEIISRTKAARAKLKASRLYREIRDNPYPSDGSTRRDRRLDELAELLENAGGLELKEIGGSQGELIGICDVLHDKVVEKIVEFFPEG